MASGVLAFSIHHHTYRWKGSSIRRTKGSKLAVLCIIVTIYPLCVGWEDSRYTVLLRGGFLDMHLTVAGDHGYIGTGGSKREAWRILVPNDMT